MREAADALANLESVKTAFDIAGTAVTAIAVIVGGYWAYFRFVRERTYRPRLEVTMAGQWREVGAHRLLHARISVKNIGTSVVTLLQEGTGLRISKLDPEIPSAPAATQWQSMRVFRVFEKHQWIEPDETISDDLLVSLVVGIDEPVLFESRLVWKWEGGKNNIVVSASQVMPPDATLV
jgi:hypothetical protein